MEDIRARRGGAFPLCVGYVFKPGLERLADWLDLMASDGGLLHLWSLPGPGPITQTSPFLREIDYLARATSKQGPCPAGSPRRLSRIGNR